MIDKLKEAIRLADEYPDLEIKVMVNHSVVPNDDYAYWHGLIGDVKKDTYWEGEDDYIIGEDNIKSHIEAMLKSDVDLDIADEQVTNEVNKLYEIMTEG